MVSFLSPKGVQWAVIDHLLDQKFLIFSRNLSESWKGIRIRRKTNEDR